MNDLTPESVPLALTFDDVLLVPSYSEIHSRSTADTGSRIARDLTLRIPILAANMDTVCRSRLARAMAREGGIGVIHRFMSVEDEAAEVQAVKRPEGVIARKVHTISADRTIEDAILVMGRQNIHSLLVVSPDDRVMGIVTSRDVLLVDDTSRPVGAVMTGGDQLVKAPVGTPLETARRILHEHRIEKLPIVDGEGRLQGLITGRDVLRLRENPLAVRDTRGELMVAAAIGAVGDTLDRARALVEAGVDLIVVDIAHGHSAHALRAVREVRQTFPDLPLMAGNVATAAGTLALIEAGADAVKVGVGPGAACSTRIVTGVGVPQLTAIMECVKAARPRGIPIIADGGIRFGGDVSKAIAAGAAAVMIGSLLAGTEESPGQTMLRSGARYKVYRGMASRGASQARRAIATESMEDLDDLAATVVPEGVEAVVPYRGTVREVLHQLVGGLRSGMSYLGATSLAEMQEKARFVRITESGLRESKPHDLTVSE